MSCQHDDAVDVVSGAWCPSCGAFRPNKRSSVHHRLTRELAPAAPGRVGDWFAPCGEQLSENIVGEEQVTGHPLVEAWMEQAKRCPHPTWFRPEVVLASSFPFQLCTVCGLWRMELDG